MADLVLGEGVAAGAMAYFGDGLTQRTREQLRTLAVMLQYMKGHARSRLCTHTGEAAQGIDEGREIMGVGHGNYGALWN
jgi:hypothetical protein